ncbi:F-box protein: endocytic membrane traffic, recycling ReCYcling 1 [Malassezia cuniculi]|uniref:F-box protein: endocytic membrane traffic, recycling ReCYcling 1 n=1 Tax=Malassezia cuniculi TaxID=948313 RepID=A0AAF0EWX5_9BASI|nr:F-box protein: endocytic membrane traffic, recycling ReCYcling 1 [Malassezia cuniculi]
MNRWQPLAQPGSAPLFSAADAFGEAAGLPKEVLVNICDHLPVKDLASVALVSKSFCGAVRDEQLWEHRWKRLGWVPISGMPEALLDSPILPIAPAADEPPRDSSRAVDLLSGLDFDTLPAPRTNTPYMSRVQRAYVVLAPFAKSLISAPSASSSLLFTRVSETEAQVRLAGVLARFVSPLVGGSVADGVQSKMREALSYIDTILRSAFREADAKRKAGESAALTTMATYAKLVWELRSLPFYVGAAIPKTDPTTPCLSALQQSGGSILVEEYIGSLEIFLTALPHDPSLNVPRSGEPLTLDGMYKFIDFLNAVVTQEAPIMKRVFPEEQHAVDILLEKITTELLADYVCGLLELLQTESDELYLDAFVKSLSIALALADGHGNDAAEIVARVWTAQLDEYLTAELAWESTKLRSQCDHWTAHIERMHQQHRDAELLGAPPSAAQKRSFITTFKRALLKPVSFSSESENVADESRADEPEPGYVGLESQRAIFDDEQPVSIDSVPMSAASMQISSLLDLNTAVELINTTRLSLQRLEILKRATPQISARVQPKIDEAVVSLFATLDDFHLKPGFAKAREQIASFKPNEHDADAPIDSRTSAQVAPLILFFDLVHIGDTIQQLMQVFFDEVATRLLSTVDFTNAAVREKRRFENDLDDNVAEGLSAGVALLIQHVEHIVLTHQSPRDFYPEQGQHLDLSKPTKACSECVACLRISCNMLATCTDKSVLDIFYEEIGLRLHSVLCKHLKKQIVSISGGFQVIADLNEYYNFVVSLKQPQLTTLFAALKRVGSLYIVDDPKELAQMVRDASLSQGTLRPEEMYEFLRSRCDFKSIERSIDAELYGFKLIEDCLVM